jgi:hypothetical protein
MITFSLSGRCSGKGNFAKFFNAGKPFVDDLNIEIEDDGKVEIKSASRVGESDFGVNKAVSRVLCTRCPFYVASIVSPPDAIISTLARGLLVKRNQSSGLECCSVS